MYIEYIIQTDQDDIRNNIVQVLTTYSTFFRLLLHFVSSQYTVTCKTVVSIKANVNIVYIYIYIP